MWSAGHLCTALKQDKLLQLVKEKKKNPNETARIQNKTTHNEYEHLNWSVPNKLVFLILHVHSLNIQFNCFYKANYALGSIPSVLKGRKKKVCIGSLMLVSLCPKPVYYMSAASCQQTVQRIWSRQQATPFSPSE